MKNDPQLARLEEIAKHRRLTPGEAYEMAARIHALGGPAPTKFVPIQNTATAVASDPVLMLRPDWWEGVARAGGYRPAQNPDVTRLARQAIRKVEANPKPKKSVVMDAADSRVVRLMPAASEDPMKWAADLAIKVDVNRSARRPWYDALFAYVSKCVTQGKNIDRRAITKFLQFILEAA
jgi:hypothetical protein